MKGVHMHESLRRSWMALLATPIGFLAAFAVGEGLMSLLGFEPGVDNPPLAQDLLISLAGFLPFALAPALSVRWGLQAWRAGTRSALIPVIISAGLLLAFGTLLLVTALQ